MLFFFLSQEFVETDAERAAASMAPAGGGKQKSKGKGKGAGLGSSELDEVRRVCLCFFVLILLPVIFFWCMVFL